jgi:hypothetical protein
MKNIWQPYRNLSFALLTTLALVSLAPAQASTTTTLEHTSRSGEITRITPQSATTADAILTDMFDVFYYVEREEISCVGLACRTVKTSVEHMCWQGDISQICSILKTLSQRADDAYDAGLHQRSTLASCRAFTGKKIIKAEIHMMSDYEAKSIKTQQLISECLAKP